MSAPGPSSVPPLTAEARSRYRDRGLLVLDPEIPQDMLDGIVCDLEPRWDKSPSRAGLLNAHRLRDAWRTSTRVKRAALWPPILKLLEDLYGREPLPFQTLNFLVGTEQPAHADTMHFNSQPAGFVCGVWLALEDMDGDNGPLVYYPGSHLWPELRMEDYGLSSSKRNYPRYTELLARRVAESGLEPELALVKKGQAILWHGNLVHGGAPRKDPMRTRLSQVTHFFFAGCRAYTPMRSRGAALFVRNPRPIREHESAGDFLAWAFGYCRPGFVLRALRYNLPHLVRTEILRLE